jgi:hypothetical protein
MNFPVKMEALDIFIKTWCGFDFFIIRNPASDSAFWFLKNIPPDPYSFFLYF